MSKEIPGWYKTLDTVEWVQHEFLSHDEKFYGVCGFRLLPSGKWSVCLLLKRRWRPSGGREELLPVKKEVVQYRYRDGLFGLFSATAKCEQLMAGVSRKFYLDRQLQSASSPAAQSEKAAVRRYDDGRDYGR